VLSPTSLQTIEASAGWRQHRIEMMDLPEGPVVVKGQRPARGPWRFRVLSALARCTRSPLLRPVPAPGGRVGQDIEVRRLLQLAQAGVAVPALLHQGERFIVLQRIAGHSLQSRLSAAIDEAARAFELGLRGLLEVHQRGQCLSQGFARNMLVCDGKVWYIDFEDDPLQAMALPDAQARDCLTYLQSTVWLYRGPVNDLMNVWSRHAALESPAVQACLYRAVRGLAWLRHLPRRRKPWGRDVVAVQALADFLHHWTPSEPALS